MNHEPEPTECDDEIVEPAPIAEAVEAVQEVQEVETDLQPLIASTEPAPEASDTARGTGQLDQISASLSDLNQKFERRFEYDAAKEKAFNKLYDQLEEQKSGVQASLKTSLIRSLLLLHDSMATAEIDLAETDLEQLHKSVAERVKSLKQELLSILYSEEVEPVGQLEAFNSQRQKVSRTVVTHDPDQDDAIETVEREGFMFQGKVMRPQTVVLRRYEDPIPDLPQPDDDDQPTAGEQQWPL